MSDSDFKAIINASKPRPEESIAEDWKNATAEQREKAIESGKAIAKIIMEGTHTMTEIIEKVARAIDTAMGPIIGAPEHHERLRNNRNKATAIYAQAAIAAYEGELLAERDRYKAALESIANADAFDTWLQLAGRAGTALNPSRR